MTLSNGTRLAYDLILPTKKGVPAEGPLPTLFKYTPYNRTFTIFDKDGNNIIAGLFNLSWKERAYLRVRYWFDSGTISDIGNVTSSGIVNTLAGLIAGPVVQPPILEEIDPYVADPAPPVDTSAGVAPAPSEEGTGDGGTEDEEEDDEGEDTSTDAAESEEDAGLVTQQSAIPAGVCGK